MSTVRPNPKNLQHSMNLLKPSIKAGSEERRRAASITRLMFLAVALVVLTMVGLKVWDIGIVISERRPDELEKVRLNEQIAGLQVVLSKVPSGALKAREDLFTQVKWSGRLDTIRELALPGQAFATYNAGRDGTVNLVGLVRDPAVYANMLDEISRVPFVAGVQSASLSSEEEFGYSFQIVFATLPAEDK